MLAYMNQESYDRTVATGYATYWSRSRKAFWVKGETSGIARRSAPSTSTATATPSPARRPRRRRGVPRRVPELLLPSSTDSGWEVVESRVFDPAAVYKK
jgi:phosphoribosyl-AMP cyclohydrolase